MTDKNTDNDKGQSQVILETRPRTKKPSMYKVIMLNVHQRGVGVCGVFSYEVAEAKATQVMDYARQNEHPLQLQIEKE